MAFHKLGRCDILAQYSGGVTMSAPAGVGWRKWGRWNDIEAECHFLAVPQRTPDCRRELPPITDVLLSAPSCTEADLLCCCVCALLLFLSVFTGGLIDCSSSYRCWWEEMEKIKQI